VTTLGAVVSELESLALPAKLAVREAEAAEGEQGSVGTIGEGNGETRLACVKLVPPEDAELVVLATNGDDGHSATSSLPSQTHAGPTGGTTLWQSGSAWVASMDSFEAGAVTVCRAHKAAILRVVPKATILPVGRRSAGAQRPTSRRADASTTPTSKPCSAAVRDEAVRLVSSNMGGTRTFMKQFSGAESVTLPSAGDVRFRTRHAHDLPMSAAAAECVLCLLPWVWRADLV
jgi:hypothetical protein